jgi:hypothetical protein
MACKQTTRATVARTEQIRAFFQAQGKKVVTFIGYSDTGYEDPEAIFEIDKGLQNELDPEQTVINIGATRSGIGAVYEIANQRGFTTTGIVSNQARKYNAELSPCVDHVSSVAN